MQCLRCGSENETESTKCIKCHAILNQYCPRCSSSIFFNQNFCGSCGLKLINQCAYCHHENMPLQEFCADCGQRLITICHHCHMANEKDYEFCISCAKPLLKTQEDTHSTLDQYEALPQYIPPRPVLPAKGIKHKKSTETSYKFSEELKVAAQQQENEISLTSPDKKKIGDTPIINLVEEGYSLRVPILSIELVNYKHFVQQEENDPNSTQAIHDFIKILESESRHSLSKLDKVSDSVMLIIYVVDQLNKSSVIRAVESARAILFKVNRYNQQLLKGQELLEIKIGISIKDNLPVISLSGQVERSVASVNQVIVSEEVYQYVQEEYSFEPIGPLPVGREMIIFYNLLSKEISTQDLIGRNINITGAIKNLEELKTLDFSMEMKTSPHSFFDIEPPSVSKYSLDLHTLLVNQMTAAEKERKGKWFNILGEYGIGKSSLLKIIRNSLNPHNYIWSVATCTMQDVNFELGAIQQVVRNFINLPWIDLDYNHALNHYQSIVNSVFGNLNPRINEILSNVILNRLIAHKSFNITYTELVDALFKFIVTIAKKYTFVICMEDIEQLDASSAQLMKDLIARGLFKYRVILITTSIPTTRTVDVFGPDILLNDYSSFYLLPLAQENIEPLLKNLPACPHLKLPHHLLSIIHNNYEGKPLYIEQFVFLLAQLGIITLKDNYYVYNDNTKNIEIPHTFSEILSTNVNIISRLSQSALKILQVASVLGFRFTHQFLKDLVNLGDDFEPLLQGIMNSGLMYSENQHTLSFKHPQIWNIIYSTTMPASTKSYWHKEVAEYYRFLLKSGVRIPLNYIAYHYQLAGSFANAVNIWKQCSDYAKQFSIIAGYTSYLSNYAGMLALVPREDSQKLQLIALENIVEAGLTFDNLVVINALTTIIESGYYTNPYKLFELYGLLARCQEKANRWINATHSYESMVSYIENNELIVALVNIMQLKALYKVGKYGKIISIVKSNAIGIVEVALKENKIPATLNHEECAKFVLHAKFIYSHALAAIGQPDVFKAVPLLLQQVTNRLPRFELRAKLILAQACYLRGDFGKASSMLSQIASIMPSLQKNDELVLMFLETKSKILLEMAKWKEAYLILQEIRRFSKTPACLPFNLFANLNIYYLMLLSGIVTETRENLTQLLDIATDNKLVQYAGISWYYISMLEKYADNLDTAENIADKAVEITSKQEFSNVESTINLGILLGEVYLLAGKIDKAKETFEIAFKRASLVQNPYQLAKVSFAMVSLYIELGNVFPEEKEKNLQRAHELLSNALKIFEEIKHTFYIETALRVSENLNTLSNLSGIKTA